MNLSQEDHDSTLRYETRLNSALLCSLVPIARVVIVRVILVDVLGVMIVVLIGLDEVLVICVAIFVVIFCNWRCTLYNKDHEHPMGSTAHAGDINFHFEAGLGNQSAAGCCLRLRLPVLSRT